MDNILVKMFQFFSTLLLSSFFRLKKLFQVKMVLLSRYFFFLNAKNLGWSDNAKGEKKEDGLIQFLIVQCDSEV